MNAARWIRHTANAVLGLVAGYVLVAYVLAPAFWSEDDRGGRVGAMLTQTADGLPGDPLNIAIEGEETAFLSAMAAAGWSVADAISFETSAGIVGSVLFDRPDRDAPVSPLYYEGRRQDLAFEKEAGSSADRRQHVRFWRAGSQGGVPLFLGSASFDAGVGLSHYTGGVTHRISPDIDAARDTLAADLQATGRVAQARWMEGAGPTEDGRNGEGDRYWTDGDATLIVLRAQ